MQPLARVCSLLFAATALAACTAESSDAKTKGAGSDQVFRFSAIPNEDQKQLRAKYDPIATYLTEKTGVKVEYVPAAKYDASVTMFKNDDIQLAWYGGLTGVQARQAVAGAQAIAKGEIDAVHKSYFIASKSSKLSKNAAFPKAAKGLRFTFGSKSSTSGRLMPQFYITKETGAEPKDFFKDVNFSGSHTKTIQLVKDGAFDIGAVDFAVYDGMVKEGKLDPNECPVIWETPNYANYQFTARPGLDERFGAGFTKKLTDALLGMDAELAGKFRRKKMVTSSNADFDGIQDVAKKLGLLR